MKRQVPGASLPLEQYGNWGLCVQKRKHFRFGPFRLYPAEQLLLRYDAPFPPAPKTLDSLLALVKNSGHLVTRDERMSGVGAW